MTAKQIRSWTEKDLVLSRVLRFVRQGWPHRVEEGVQPYFRRRLELSVVDNCLLWGARVVVPRPGRRAVIEELHGGHPGIVRMKALARSYAWWPNMSEDLEKQVQECAHCQESQHLPAPAPLHSWGWAEEPWVRLHLDYAGPFQGRMFLVLVDAYSKWMEVMPVRSATAAGTTAKLRHVHGLPERIVTDNGPQFTSQEFKEFLEKNGITHIPVAPYHPSSNGQDERAVQTFKNSN